MHFVASTRGSKGVGAAGDPAWSAAVLIERGRLVDSAVVRGHLDAPYAPGLLAMREGRLLAEAVAQLRQAPDVLLVNATGRDHPRRAGLALHLGASIGMPTVGVTDRPLVADGAQPGLVRGAIAELRLGDELVGCRLRTSAGARPVVVHAGWRIDPRTACSVVLELGGSTRTPAPLREARQLARTGAHDGADEQRVLC
jgi:deoxyribonuclease V